MHIALHDLAPVHLAGVSSPGSGIWNRDLVFESGKYYLILAPSGTGKSTLLLTLYGIFRNYKGSICFDDKDISSFELDDWADSRQTQLSFVFQDLRLFPHITAMENILLKAGLTNSFAEQEIAASAGELGIADLLHRTCGTLSFGEQQRVAIIRSLVQPFKFLLLDEPFSHLDDDNISKAIELIVRKARDNNAGIVMSSLGNNYGMKFDFTLMM